MAIIRGMHMQSLSRMVVKDAVEQEHDLAMSVNATTSENTMLNEPDSADL